MPPLPHPSTAGTGERFFAPTHNVILPSGVCSPFVGATHASPLRQPGCLTYPRTGVLPPAGPSAWVALAPRSRRRRLGKWGQSSATPGPPGGRTDAQRGVAPPDPGAVRNAACPALVARRDDTNRGRGGRTLSLSKGRRGGAKAAVVSGCVSMFRHAQHRQAQRTLDGRKDLELAVPELALS